MASSAPQSPLRYVRLGLWALVAVVSVALLAFYALRDGTPPQVSQIEIGAPFTLTDHHGKTVSDTDFRGKFLVIYFGFTYCPDICPTSLQLIGAALDKLSPDVRSQVQPLFITVDPERDTPELLAPYVTHFVPDMVGLTGSPEAIKAVADGYRVAYWKVEDQDSALPYTVDHASLIFIMDKKGQFLTQVVSKPGFGGADTPDGLAEVIRSAIDKG